MQIQKPIAVIFDWDGTLVDSLDFVFDAHNHVRNHFKLAPWTRDEFKVYMKHSSKDIYPSIYGDKAEDAFRVLVKFSEDNYASYVKAFDGTAETLDALRKAGIRTSIVSNMRHDILQKQVDHLGLRHYFEVVAGAGYAPRDKPAPDPLLQVLSEMGLQAGPGILYVGDTETDLLCAMSAKCPVGFLTHGLNQDSLIKTYQPNMVMKNIKDFYRMALTF